MNEVFHIQEEMEVGARCRRKVKGGKPRKSAHLVPENRTDTSGEKDIFHDERKGTRRKMKILKLEPMAALECKLLVSVLLHL